MAKKLNDDHEKFCVEYCKDQNGTQAYQRAYPEASAASARTAAANLLAKHNIQERIQQLKAPALKKAGVTRERVIQELANIAFASIGLVCTQDEEGDLTLKPLDDMEEGAQGTIHSVKQSRHYDRDGNLLSVKHNFNLHDKIKALELLSKHLGLLDGDAGSGDESKGAKEGRLFSALDRIEDRLSKRRTGSK